MIDERKATRPVPVTAPRSLTPWAIRLYPGGPDHPIPEVGGRLRIGSDPDNELVVADEHVSASHCVLERRAPHVLVVRDQRSTNGTYVDGVRVNEGPLAVGACLTLGRSQLAVVARAAPATSSPGRGASGGILGRSPPLLAVLARAERAARASQGVLLIGESGTGKELFARMIHERSRRSQGPLVAINCGAIAESLVESELFGHERGAFTGAGERRAGVFEEAHGGTLFLDEIGELPPSQQAKLLRVIESGQVRRVGGAGERTVDVRIVAATHRDLPREIARGRFRLDLYHRLAAIELAIPPLRARPDDLPELCDHFLAMLAREHGRHVLADDAQRALAAHRWPGNVRELKHVLSRAVALAEHRMLTANDLFPTSVPSPVADQPAAAIDVSMHDVMRNVITRAIERHGTQRRAAASLGMARSTFNERVHRYGLGDVARRARVGDDDPCRAPLGDHDPRGGDDDLRRGGTPLEDDAPGRGD